MAYLTFNQLSTTTTLRKSSTLNESLRARTYTETNVFLSYRRKDRQYVEAIVKFLKGIGINLYVDYLDETLEDKTNENVAAILRDRIKSCNKFISVATPDSGNSKWMPWELGLGDRIINYKNVAILPLTNSAVTWNDQEYGKIYGRVEGSNSYVSNGPDDWYVIYPDGSKIKLKEWFLKN
ncbi:TIR domain-containing protein [Flavobacterium sp. MAH-1]|uniref:TIR domain-containing protein n=1 Tax=Flavobacterium agri TaxID=2743471 RepID=A0A7Y8Y3N1_9FLAO|nr:toll/interleukin-1 receptor domain-containing protein [Flavobacterium agri]NUY81898.1 TIR domain-containing protein [Flavobacterium agri]NYA71922.1 TIR domain-containing protein [Flavobacterium agri]